MTAVTGTNPCCCNYLRVSEQKLARRTRSCLRTTFLFTVLDGVIFFSS